MTPAAVSGRQSDFQLVTLNKSADVAGNLWGFARLGAICANKAINGVGLIGIESCGRGPS
jgi:hypothetical protein